MRAILRTVLLPPLFAACAAAPPLAQDPAPGVVAVPEAPGIEGVEWVEQTLAGMTLREKVGQLVMPRISGGYLAIGSAEHERLRTWVQEYHIGGVIITIGPPYELAAKLNLMQEMAAVPLLVSADMEHGPGQILATGTMVANGIDNGGATRFPPLMAFGAAGDERLAYELGRITALEARAAGVHVAFAPVVDVNNNPSNPIINIRSYSADPQLVARLARAHVRGLQENGMLATAKHFPGHGDTGRDSHITPLFINVGRARADSVELVPFRSAIAADVAGVMSAHIVFPALTADSVPATLNSKLLQGLLRDEMGFTGLLFTDALDMGAIVRVYSNETAPVMAVRAGIDVLLQVNPGDVGTVVEALIDAVEKGDLPRARVDEAVRRILTAKARLDLHRRRTVDLDRLPHVLGSAPHQEIAQEAADRSITLVRDARNLVPLAPGARVLSVVYTDDFDPWAGRTLQRALTPRGNVQTVFLDARSDAAALTAATARADSADVVIFSPFIRVSAGKIGLALPDPIAAFADGLAARKPLVVVSFGNPYIIQQLPNAHAYMVAWGQWDAPQRAAARALLGEIDITGRLPIPLPPEYTVGTGIQREVRD